MRSSTRPGHAPARLIIEGDHGPWTPAVTPSRPDDPAVQVPPVVEGRVVDRPQRAVGRELGAVGPVPKVRPQEVVRAVVMQVELDLGQELLALRSVELLAQVQLY